MQAEIPNVIAFAPEGNRPGGENPDQNEFAGSSSPGKDQTILVVDDSLSWLGVARRILIGYQVRTCEDPREALSLLEQNSEQIDLVITDLEMPRMSGIELAAELLKINATLPVVLTSVTPLPMPLAKLRSLGIRDFLTKPWNRGRLFSIVRSFLPRVDPV